MLYVADLHHDGLLKVGITYETRERVRQGELRRQLCEPELEVFVTAPVPGGWGDDRSWEKRLLKNIRERSGRLQMFASQHASTEVVEATREQARAELYKLLRATEIDPSSSAVGLDGGRVDWRFANFVSQYYSDCREPTAFHCDHHWRNLVTRQAFLYHLRGEPIGRGERINLGLSCKEIEEILEAQSTT